MTLRRSWWAPAFALLVSAAAELSSLDAAEGRRYVVTARLLAGAPYVLGGTDGEPPDEWEVRVESTAGERVFAASSGEVAERLMVLLGEELELGLLEG